MKSLRVLDVDSRVLSFNSGHLQYIVRSASEWLVSRDIFQLRLLSTLQKPLGERHPHKGPPCRGITRDEPEVDRVTKRK